MFNILFYYSLFFRFAIPYINVLFDHIEKYEVESETSDTGPRGLIVASIIEAKDILSKYYSRMHTKVFTTCTALEPRIKFMWHQQNRTGGVFYIFTCL